MHTLIFRFFRTKNKSSVGNLLQDPERLGYVLDALRKKLFTLKDAALALDDECGLPSASPDARMNTYFIANPYVAPVQIHPGFL